MHRITNDTGRQLLVPCPRCQTRVGLWMRIVDADEMAKLNELNGVVDVTAALAEPADRLRAMERQAEAEVSVHACPWIQCLSCGYDGLYQFGGGIPGGGMTQAIIEPGRAREQIEALAKMVGS